MSKDEGSSDEAAVLHMVCGKIASGKSTLTKRLASTENAVVISEDVWMAHLYPGEIRTLDDYVRCSGRIRRALSDHVQALLSAGMSVTSISPSIPSTAVHGGASYLSAPAWDTDFTTSTSVMKFARLGSGLGTPRASTRSKRPMPSSTR